MSRSPWRRREPHHSHARGDLRGKLKAGFVFDVIGAVPCVAGVIVMANLVGLA